MLSSRHSRGARGKVQMCEASWSQGSDVHTFLSTYILLTKENHVSQLIASGEGIHSTWWMTDAGRNEVLGPLWNLPQRAAPEPQAWRTELYSSKFPNVSHFAQQMEPLKQKGLRNLWERLSSALVYCKETCHQLLGWISLQMLVILLPQSSCFCSMNSWTKQLRWHSEFCIHTVCP